MEPNHHIVAANTCLCHPTPISYNPALSHLAPRWFEDQELVQRKRAAAAVCLPRLPGPTPHGPPLQELEAGLLGDASFQSYQVGTTGSEVQW